LTHTVECVLVLTVEGAVEMYLYTHKCRCGNTCLSVCL